MEAASWKCLLLLTPMEAASWKRLLLLAPMEAASWKRLLLLAPMEATSWKHIIHILVNHILLNLSIHILHVIFSFICKLIKQLFNNL